MKRLVVGLGNPGKKYEKTRHNIGFMAVDLLAEKHGLKFRQSEKFQGALAEGLIGGESCLLLKPLTFMNLSGESVALTMRYYSVDLSALFVLADDVSIPFGHTRVKIDSGPGGHNGFKSVEESLQTNRYARLRLGVGDRQEGDLSSHVLGRFSEEEEKLVPKLLERAVEATEIWIVKGITRAMDFANRNEKPIDPKHGT
jgi:PTH1 family peptidyl-tRNA hydrolase